jgi:hypothetical protein
MQTSSQASALALPFDTARSVRAGRSAFGWIRAGLGCAAAIAALVILAREGMREEAAPTAIQPVKPAVLVAPAPAWQAIANPRPHYAIDLPELKALSQAHEARRHANGGREDKLVYGVFESDRPYLRIALFRGPREADRPASFFLDLARRAGEAGLAVVRSERAATLETKLGLLEAAEIVLSDSVERRCLAFRLQHAEIGFSAHGWRCPAETHEHAIPACLIDRLAVLPAAEDAPLKILFAQAERRRNPICGPSLEPKRKTA